MNNHMVKIINIDIDIDNDQSFCKFTKSFSFLRKCLLHQVSISNELIPVIVVFLFFCNTHN